MPSEALVVCDCASCEEKGLTDEISLVIRSRHRKSEALWAAIASTHKAERLVATKLVSQAAPSALTLVNSDRAHDHSRRPMATYPKSLSNAGRIPAPTGPGALMTQNAAKFESTIWNIIISVIRESTSMSRPETLDFMIDPVPEHQDRWQNIQDELKHHPDAAQCYKYNYVLSKNVANQEFLRSENVLRESLSQIHTLIHLVGARTVETGALLDQAHEARRMTVESISQLMFWKQEVWNAQLASRRVGSPESPSSERDAGVVDPARFSLSKHIKHHPLVLSSVVHVVLANLVFGLSMEGCETFLDGFRHHTRTAVAYSQGALPASLPDGIPKTLTGAFHHLDLNPSLRQYIVCPRCHSLYPGVQPYPPQCRNRPIPGEAECQAALLMERRINGKAFYTPIKTYLHHDFKLWLARFLSRPGIVAFIRASQQPCEPGEDGTVSDILGSTAIRNFLGADHLPFLRPVNGQYRLLFALSVDGFNPLTNKVAKQVRSSTGIYLICLNLPLAARQLPHNMYLVGVVPGPSKPKEGELNHYLDLIVDDFMPFWESGIHYASTALDSGIMLCFAAIVLVICDALGAREVSGFPTITSMQFCVYCSLPLTEIEDFDFTKWPLRTCAEHRELAEQWRSAKLSERVLLQKRFHAARYTSLLRLPYFDPIRSTAIDTMHILFLGAFERHCRNVWGMNVKLEDGDGRRRGAGVVPSPPTPDDLDAGRLILISGKGDDFHKRGIKKDVLYYICQENGLRTGGKKRDLVKELRKFLAQRNQEPTQPEPLPSAPSFEAGPPQSSQTPLALQILPAVTRDIMEQFSLAENRIAKGMSLKRCPNNPLLMMCYLRNLTFETRSPTKSVMISALLSWREERLRHHEWVPSMHVSQLETLASVQMAQAQGEGNQTTAQPVAGGSAFDMLPSVDEDDVQASRAPPSSKRSMSAVLGSGVLNAYVLDRQNMVLPSWITAPPAKAGHTSHGKMSADQWRVFCTVNLPVTLIRIWGVRQSESRWYKMLLNFLDLVLAVEVASLVTTSDSLIAHYDRLMHRYLDTLKSLYKDTPIAPNQHICLHIGDVMRGFGPSPGYRTFGTERFNFTLQQVQTNRHDFGQMEMTMTRSVCRASNLIALLEHPHALPQHFQGTLSRVLQRDNRGTRINEVLPDAQETVTLPQFKNPTNAQSQLEHSYLSSLMEYLNSDGGNYVPHSQETRQSSEIYIYPKVTYLRTLVSKGASYRTSQHSLGSSHTIVQLEDGSHKPAQIQKIFRHARDSLEGRKEEVFLAVRFLQPLSATNRERDPYRAVNRFYGDGPFKEPFGTLWASDMERHVSTIRPRNLVCHFARTTMTVEPIPVPCYHVRALSRLRTQYEQNGTVADPDHEAEASDVEMGDSSDYRDDRDLLH